MKNIFRILMAVAVLFTASCAKEDISTSIAGGEANVTFTVDLPELGTRAYGDGTKVDILRYNVYEYGTEIPLTQLSGYKEAQAQGQSLYTITIPMLKGMKYDIVFWAEKQGTGYYTLAGKEITVNYTGAKANDEDRDAFFGSVTEFDPTNPGNKTSVELRRPFAQLNAITTDCQLIKKSGITAMYKSSLKVTSKLHNKFNIFSGVATGGVENVEFAIKDIPAETKTIDDNTDMHLAMNYLLVNGEKALVDVELSFVGKRGSAEFRFPVAQYSGIPVKRNYRTNIIGKLLTATTEFDVKILPGFDAAYDVEGETVTAKVDTVEEFVAAIEDDSVDVVVLDGDIDLNDLLTRANNDPSLTIKSGKEFTIDLNGNTLSATSTQTGKNYNMFDVRGTLTVKNGTMEYEHLGENMGWGSSTNLFNVTAGGVLNLEGVTAKNLGGSDMGFVAHLNNWGEVTLNVENCTLESNYVAVRVFNSGYDMNNVTIKNSTLKGVSAAFWVHNYTVEDFGSTSKAEAQKALLNLNIYGQGNEFTPDINGIRYGFTNSIRTDAYGITKTVSEDGTEVTLGSIVENGIVRRGVAGDEENYTIKKAIVSEGVTTLYDRTFRRFYALETVELPSTLTTIGAAGSGVFQSCTALKNIVLPESVTVLGKGTFQECSSLKSINIPAGVTRIESDCLRATGLEEVEFHAGVTYFGAMAFRDCKQLKKVVINAPEFTMEGNTFGIMAAPFTPMTIEVANAEMKAYVESKLTAHDKTYITVVGPTSVSNADELKNAIINGGKFELANDITVDKWIMFSEDLNIGNGTIITLDEINVNIDGKGHTLTINSIESAGNNDQLFQGATNLNIANLTIKYADGLTYGGLGMRSGVIKNVHFVGGGAAASSAAIFPGVDEIKVEDCVFDTNGAAFYFDHECDNLTVNRCTFNQKDNKNVILLRGDVKFTDNIINSGRTVNIVSGSPVVTGNDFNDVRLKVYQNAKATVANNIINNLVFETNTYRSTFTNNTLSTEAQDALGAATFLQ